MSCIPAIAFRIELKVVEYYEHQGTHMDAPMHFARGREDMASVPVNKLVGPGVVIDVQEKAANDPDYAVTVKDLQGINMSFH